MRAQWRGRAPRGSIGGVPEQIMALVIAAAFMVPLSAAVFSWIKTQEEVVATQQLLAVRKAAADYIKNNWATVYAWAASPQRLSVSSLISAGYLSSGYQSTNAFGQTHQVVLRQVGTNLVEAVVVTTGGTAIEAGRIAGAALRGGADAGYMPYGTDPTPCSLASCARGTKRGWELSLSPYGSTGVTAEPGHLAALLHVNGGEVLTDYLYRYAVPGLPDANTMHTAINMNTNDITLAKNITATAAITGGGVVTGTAGVLPDLVVTSGAACGSPGLLGRLADGSLMVCQNGAWMSGAGSFGGVYMIEMDISCGSITNTSCVNQTCLTRNPYTGGCSCPSGTTQSLLEPLLVSGGSLWKGTVQCTNGAYPVQSWVWVGTTAGDGDGTGSGDGGGGGGGGGGP